MWKVVSTDNIVKFLEPNYKMYRSYLIFNRTVGTPHVNFGAHWMSNLRDLAMQLFCYEIIDFVGWKAHTL